MTRAQEPLITTIKEKCRVCYTCVRNCPAKAIRVSGGQAEVIAERCLGCGNCVRLCSQSAKKVWSRWNEIARLLEKKTDTTAIIAPSFPVEFADITPEVMVGMLKALGFTYVHQVAFGADLVARAYAQMVKKTDRAMISTTCPAVVSYVEKYLPDLVPNLAPIVSPMVASAKVARAIHGDQTRIVFIGPCIAKKGEARDLPGHEVDYALTFSELRTLLEKYAITPASAAAAPFDGPAGKMGMLFPLNRGLLQAADITEDLSSGDIVSADGQANFIEVLTELEQGHLDGSFYDVLCCQQGCIMGPGFTKNTALYKRRQLVSRNAKQSLDQIDEDRWLADMKRYASLDLTATFAAEMIPPDTTPSEEINQILKDMGKFTPDDELNCGACGYNTCYEHAVAIHNGFAEKEMCLPYSIDQLNQTISKLEQSHVQLASTQEALVHSEKLASMGQLAAGIAHEVNNPLGVVIMYSNLLMESNTIDPQIKADVEMIVENSMRCKKIVSGLLRFARQNRVVKKKTDLRELIKTAIQTVQLPKSITLTINEKLNQSEVEIDDDQILQVLVNLLANSRDAITKQSGHITIDVWDDAERFYIKVHDDGCGIAKYNFSKIFNPFFTTKQIGKGTGLGLAVSYGIVKIHSGDIKVESNADPEAGPTWTAFTISIPSHEPVPTN